MQAENKVLEENMATEHEHKDFGFKQFGKLIKKSFFRIFIFSMIAGLVMGIVSIGVHFGTRNANASVSAIIDFSYRGIESGKDPNLIHNLDVNKVKSPSVVNSAIVKLNSQNVDIKLSKISDIINNIVIEGQIPRNIANAPENTTYFPSRYRVSIINLKDCGLNANTARLLLDTIIEEYEIYFNEEYRKTYRFESVFLNTVMQDSFTIKDSRYEFVEVYDLLNREIRNAVSLIDTITNEHQNTAFHSIKTGQTFQSVRDELIRERSSALTRIQINVSAYALSSNIPATIRYLEKNMADIQANLTRAEADHLGRLKLIEEYDLGTIIVADSQGGGTIGKGGPTEEYNRLFRSAEASLLEINQLTLSLELTDNMLQDFKAYETTNEADREIAKQAVEEEVKYLAEAILKQLELAGTIAEEYIETQVLRDAVRKALPTVYQAPMTDSARITLVISAIVVVLSALSAVAVTYAVMKKRGESLFD